MKKYYREKLEDIYYRMVKDISIITVIIQLNKSMQHVIQHIQHSFKLGIYFTKLTKGVFPS